jgi:hypothetical protein
MAEEDISPMALMNQGSFFLFEDERDIYMSGGQRNQHRS